MPCQNWRRHLYRVPMGSIHNNRQLFSMRPRPVPIHYRVPRTSHNIDHNPSVHNEMVPIPNCNQTSMPIHHQSGSNDPESNTEQNLLRHQESIHNPSLDSLPILRRGLTDHRKPGNLGYFVELMSFL